jgi:hypothetical protein
MVEQKENACLPRREIPRIVPLRSGICWNLEFLPVMTALFNGVSEFLGDEDTPHHFRGEDTNVPTSLYAVDPFAMPDINGSVRALTVTV